MIPFGLLPQALLKNEENWKLVKGIDVYILHRVFFSILCVYYTLSFWSNNHYENVAIVVKAPIDLNEWHSNRNDCNLTIVLFNKKNYIHLFLAISFANTNTVDPRLLTLFSEKRRYWSKQSFFLVNSVVLIIHGILLYFIVRHRKCCLLKSLMGVLQCL